MGGDMFQRSHLELLFIVPSTSFRSAVRAFIRAARHARTSAQQPCTAPPPPNHQRPVCTNYDGPARVAPRHAPATEAFCVSPSPTTKGQSALTTRDSARVPSPRPRLLWQAVQSSSKFGLGWWYSYSVILS